MTLPLPPGIDRATFHRAMDECRKVVGGDWVFTSEEDVLLYRDAFSPFWDEPEEIIPAAAVAPDTTEEVQDVVRIANRYRIPVYAISTGKNLGYGGSAPSMTGSVVLDLKRMNRILEVNEKQAYCLVEPGVSYFDMYNYLQEHHIKLWIDCPDPGWGSLVGNALDRGAGYTAAQYRNHFDAHCGMEVVLANGEVLRTGMGALPNSKTWQCYKSGYGPWIDGMFSQSNFGVVTKMGFWMMPEPESNLKGIVHVRRYRDLKPLVEIMTHLENSKVFNGYPDIYSQAIGTPGLAGVHDFWIDGPDREDEEYRELLSRGAGPEEYEAYALKHGIPFWSCIFSFYGPEKVVRAQWEHVQERFQAEVPGVTFEEKEFFKTPLSEEQKKNLDHPGQLGIPTLRTFIIGARTPWNPHPGDHGVWFSPLIPRDADEVFRINAVLGQAARERNVEMGLAFNTPFPCWERCFMFIISFPISKEDPEVNKRMRKAFREIVEIAAEHGWAEYRTPVIFQDDVMSVYSFNDNALLRFHETVKDAVDPNGILAPGHYGIWPKHLRDRKKRT